MRTTRTSVWVVYQAAVKGMEQGPNAVCDQAEWDAMEAAAPGLNRLIRGGITNEAEAERRARGTSGDFVPRGAAKTIAA
ncbi:MAG TPA: hypothetical protein VD866_10215 [Urbifossiella sp.]|nr:hypothetical protein [Urbifossiella sp.]